MNTKTTAEDTNEDSSVEDSEKQELELNSDNLKMLYIPEGFAHGFQTLEDNTEVSYQMTQYYMPEFAEGIRWNDIQFNIDWPIKFPILSEKDKKYSDFDSGNFQNE